MVAPKLFGALRNPVFYETIQVSGNSVAKNEHMYLLVGHATGFCINAYRPFIHALGEKAKSFASNITIVKYDISGHGRSYLRGADPINWPTMAVNDIREVLDKVNIKSDDLVHAVGHSFGATALIETSLQDKSEVPIIKAICGFEPAIFPQTQLRKIPVSELPLVKGALKRRRSWKNMEECRASFLSKPLFAGFHPESLNGYLEDGFVVNDDKTVELACSPEYEARMYSSREPTWERLHNLRIPTRIVAGNVAQAQLKGRMDTTLFENMVKEIPGNYPLVLMDNVSHFMPLEKPEACAEVASKLLHWG